MSVLDKGSVGVDVFFVISGFIMTYIAASHFGSAAESKRFILKRLARIVPAYWFYTTVMLAIILTAPSWLRHTEVTRPYVIASYLFFPVRQPGTGQTSPLLELGWTLNYEMYFYVLFALAMLFSRRIGFALLSVYFVVAVSAGRFIVQSTSVQYWTRPIILEFLAGAGIGLAFVNGFRISRRAALAAAAVGLIWFVLLAPVEGEALRPLIFGVPACLFVGAATLYPRAGLKQNRRAIWRILVLLGDASYSLYLSHMFVVRAGTEVIQPQALGPLYLPAYLGLVMIGAVAVAMLSNRVIELPSKVVLERALMKETATGYVAHASS